MACACKSSSTPTRSVKQVTKTIRKASPTNHKRVIRKPVR